MGFAREELSSYSAGVPWRRRGEASVTVIGQPEVHKLNLPANREIGAAD
jgi:hypothetical protein